MTAAVYVALHGENLICIGARGLGIGPINVELASPAGSVSGLESGMTGSIESGVLRLGATFAMAVRSGITWTPPIAPPFDTRLVTLGLGHLRASAARHLPADGLAPIVLAERPDAASNPLWRAASGPIAQLQRGLPSALSHGVWPKAASAAAERLLGLGPGLTPSGDDLLGGVMLALAAAGRADLQQSLWRAIAPRLADLTSPISAAHLRAAAEGMAAQPLHDMLGLLFLGGTDRLDAGLRALSAVGHTSGWDALSGLVIALDALSAQENRSSPA